ncbi:macro domain-containing protein [Paenibacillus sp. PR3]|uniref:Macro domain-containing protein n=1 Tax=Paenibacillus terricola TaxID=2763503 RepID=A0ABR8N1V1_9BACL|nr:macro domain-containing protein [Paenibacillus terricola]MBD3922142.1 macro domain-containing protein [Paenibacillus terricola]
MAVIVIDGDLLHASEDIIGHQVNCQGVMGSGVARALRDRYGNLYPSYKQFCNQYDSHQLLGQCQLVRTGSKFTANLFGQLNFGRQNVLYTNYEALKQSLTTLKEEAKRDGYSIALPYNIGCGLANGDWNVVESMLQEVFEDYEVTLYRLGS